MPLYSFECEKCGKVFDEIVSSDTKTQPCPNCGNPAERQLAVPGGYRINGANGASTRPRNVFKGVKQ